MNSIYKIIGFLSYDKNNLSSITKKMETFSLSIEDSKYLNQTYHSEYLDIMFSNKIVKRFYSNTNHEISIIKIETNVKVDKFEMFMFNEKDKKDQIALFSLSISFQPKSIDDISNVSFLLKNYNCEIIFDKKLMSMKEFISLNFLNGHKFYEYNNSTEEFAGSRFKNYLIIDFNHEIDKRNDLLYEIGTCSKIGTIASNDYNKPSKNQIDKMLLNKLDCFENYSGLSLLDSFTVIGNKNYLPDHQYSHKLWENIYFSIYVFNLYMKCSLQILSNKFSEKPMKKRKEFQNFYNKYYYSKISFNFLPNEIHKSIKAGLEIDNDIKFIGDRLETVAVQVNEKQQKQQESLLLILSLIALLETPLHVDGISRIVDIQNEVLYNSIVYTILVAVLFIFLVKRVFNKN